MPNGTLDGFNHVLDFDEGLTDVFRVSAIVSLRQSFRDVASVRNLSISCCDQLLNVLVILSHSGGLLLINLFARQPRQLGDIRRDPPRVIAHSGLGSVPINRIVGAIEQVLRAAVAGHFEIATNDIPLSKVEQAWSSDGYMPRA
jgi:hypothetical protein